MKGIIPLFLGIFGTFAFSWAGLILIPNYQIGHLEPQMEEDETDPYPIPKSGMADRGRQIYAANGCVIATASKFAPIMPLPISSENGVSAAARREIIFSSARWCWVK